MPVTAEDRNQALQVHRYRVFQESGLSLEYLAKCAIEELNAYHVEEQWVPGDMGSDMDADRGSGQSIPTPSGWVATKRWKDWPTRQRARIDLQKMADMYPTQRHSLEESITVQIIGDALSDPLAVTVDHEDTKQIPETTSDCDSEDPVPPASIDIDIYDGDEP